jgi:hypothetical protein
VRGAGNASGRTHDLDDLRPCPPAARPAAAAVRTVESADRGGGDGSFVEAVAVATYCLRLESTAGDGVARDGRDVQWKPRGWARKERAKEEGGERGGTQGDTPRVDAQQRAEATPKP